MFAIVILRRVNASTSVERYFAPPFIILSSVQQIQLIQPELGNHMPPLGMKVPACLTVIICDILISALIGSVEVDLYVGTTADAAYSNSWRPTGWKN